jgi:hypothetical protein
LKPLPDKISGTGTRLVTLVSGHCYGDHSGLDGVLGRSAGLYIDRLGGLYGLGRLLDRQIQHLDLAQNHRIALANTRAVPGRSSTIARIANFITCSLIRN